MTRRIVIATGNPGKLREFRHLLAPLGWEVIPQTELNVAPAEEPHPTFLENALAKARHAASATGLPALADDSGICAAALDGAPGVLSARFAGEPSDDARNNEELLRRLASERDRRAHYTCVLAAVRAADDPEPLIADARWHGVIIDRPRGAAASATTRCSCCPNSARPRPNSIRRRRTASATGAWQWPNSRARSPRPGPDLDPRRTCPHRSRSSLPPACGCRMSRR